MEILDHQDVLRRAHGDWSRKSGRGFKPCNARHVEFSGLEYVVLSDECQVLAVYRVGSRRQLKRRKWWPVELEELLNRAESVPQNAVSGASGSDTSDRKPHEGSVTSVRDHPEILGFRLQLMRWRGVAAKASNDVWVRKLDAAIDVLRKS